VLDKQHANKIFVKKKITKSCQLTYITIAAIKYIQWAVICGGLHVVGVILHLHLYRITFIVFTTLKLLVAILLGQSLHHREPLDRISSDN
jgi:hypothetical protein